MKLTLLALTLILTSNFANANVCGSDASKYLVPDYFCFDNLGMAIYGKYCIGKSNSNFFLQKVNFTNACQVHDDCYGKKGAVKKSCDAEFYYNLKIACNTQIKQGSTNAFKACIKKALLYNDVVRGQATRHTLLGDFQKVPFTGKSGCDAYIDGQNKAGVANPSCDGSNEVVSEATPTSDANQTQSNTNQATTSSNGGMINIDWPTELKVSCDSQDPAFTDIVISVNGLEQNANYQLLLKGYNGGSRYIYSNRTSDPKIMFKKAYAGKYEAEVWFRWSRENKPKDKKLIASRAFTITRPEPKLTAPVNVPENTPFKVTLSNVIPPLKRGNMYLTVVPKYFPLNDYRERNGHVKNCEPLEHTFKGLSNGQYEIRLIQTRSGGGILLASQEITVGDD